MKKNLVILAVALMAAVGVTTSCGNKPQKEESQAGQVNNFRIKRGTNISH